ncbi:MAG TPA: O-methyltransferase [Alloiococcus sp.]|nr:O-methyltransferase [Alloiococcus sp.]
MPKRNEMMDRPVINNDVREYLRNNQKQLSGKLKKLEQFANENRIPVIPHETVVYFIWLFNQIKPTSVLEVGTAIGFSASLMAEYMDQGTVTTIERNPKMYERAEKVFKDLGLEERIILKKGQANEILEELEDEAYDFVFMDSAKAKYYSFFPEVFRVVKSGGVIAIDDVLQGGTILNDEKDIPRRVRKIHRKLNDFLDVVLDHPALDSTILPLGDGLLLITKKEDADFSFMKEE